MLDFEKWLSETAKELNVEAESDASRARSRLPLLRPPVSALVVTTRSCSWRLSVSAYFLARLLSLVASASTTATTMALMAGIMYCHMLVPSLPEFSARPTYQRALIVQFPAAADAPIH